MTADTLLRWAGGAAYVLIVALAWGDGFIAGYRTKWRAPPPPDQDRMTARVRRALRRRR